MAVQSPDHCRALIQAAFPRLRTDRVCVLGEGWDSTAFEVDSHLIFRFPKRAAVDHTLQQEIRLLPELKQWLPVSVPDFAWVSGPVGDYPWHFVGYEKLHGEPVASEPLEPEQIRSLAQELGQFLSRLHRFPVRHATERGIPVFTPQPWRIHYRQLYESAWAVASEHLPDPIQQRFSTAWEARLECESNWQFEPVLIHGDLALEHILLNPSGPRVTGVIDWGDATVGDPALDFAGLPESLVRAVAKHYTDVLDPTFWWRREVYRLAKPLHALVVGRELARTDLIDHGVNALAQLHSAGRLS